MKGKEILRRNGIQGTASPLLVGARAVPITTSMQRESYRWRLHVNAAAFLQQRQLSIPFACAVPFVLCVFCAVFVWDCVDMCYLRGSQEEASKGGRGPNRTF